MNSQRHSRSMRRALLVGLSTMTLATGCATMKSPTSWFSRDTETAAAPAAEPSAGFASSITNAGKGIGGQVKTMGTAVSSAMGKAKNAVVAPFTTPAENGDPTSLANMPSNLGPEIWVTNGQLYESQGKFAKALDNYTKALEVEPTNEAALLSTARLYARQQQYAPAEEFFKKMIAVKPQADTYNELAMVQQKQNRPADAQASVQKAIELDPTNARYRNNLAGMLVAGGRSDEAVQQLQQVFPPAVANYNVAYLHFSNQNLAGAQQHLQLALQADPNLKEARDLMNRISASPTAQTAASAYQTASQIYRTAESLTSPTPPAAYPQQPPAAYPQPPAAGYTQQTQQPATASQPAQPGYPPAGNGNTGYPASYPSQPAAAQGGYSAAR